MIDSLKSIANNSPAIDLFDRHFYNLAPKQTHILKFEQALADTNANSTNHAELFTANPTIANCIQNAPADEIKQTEDRLLRLSESDREKVINPRTNSPYTDADLRDALISAYHRKISGLSESINALPAGWPVTNVMTEELNTTQAELSTIIDSRNSRIPGNENVALSDAEINRYLSENNGSAGASFDIPVRPELGIVSTEVFIAADRVPAYSPIFLHGDDREFSPGFDPATSRATLTLDFEAGRGFLTVNGSTLEVVVAPKIEGPNLPNLPNLPKIPTPWGGIDLPDLPDLPKLPDFPGYHQTFFADAQPIHIGTSEVPDDDTYILVDESDCGAVDVRLHTSIGFDDVIPDQNIPFVGTLDPAPEIDFKLTITDGDATISGDEFPSIGVYQWNNGEVTTLLQRQEQHAWDLVGGVED